MSTSEIAVTTTEWTKITNPGESGTSWKKTGFPIVIDHTDQSAAATLPIASALVTVGKSKRIPLDEDNGNVLLITADNASDVFYALALGNNEGKIAVDVG